MSESIVSQSLFDSIRRFSEEGQEYWSARELMPLLGYRKWARLEDSIARAKISCENSGQESESHFNESTNAVWRSQGGGSIQSDYRLSRYGVYLVAMSGDPRKPEISTAQAYFAKKCVIADFLAWQSTGKAPNPLEPISGTSMWEKDRSGFVYLMLAEGSGKQKIGYSKNVYRRRESLQTSCPFELTVEHRIFSTDSVSLERALHQYFEAYWIRGEWFDLPQDLIANFVAIASQIDEHREEEALRIVYGSQRQTLLGESL